MWQAILSGPAGGVVGYAKTAFDPAVKQPVIGFDMGGTSTDVSRWVEWSQCLCCDGAHGRVCVHAMSNCVAVLRCNTLGFFFSFCGCARLAGMLVNWN